MSTLQFKRMPRLAAPRPPGGEVHLEPPPEIPRVVPGNIVQKVLPGVMIVASLGMMAFMLQRAKDNPMMMMMPMMMLVSTVGMMAGGGREGGQKKAEMNEDRKDYLRYLGQMRQRAREAADEQRLAREWVHPDPQTLWSIADGSRRMWERRPNDNDFCQVRVGRGSQRLETRLVPPQTGPVEELEPITTLALRRFVRAHSLVSGLPIATSLRGFAAVGLQGERELARGLARAVLTQLATFHTPEDVIIAVASSGRSRSEWDWVKWLPHAQHPTETDGIGPMRLMAGSLRAIEEMLGEELADRPRFQRNAAPPEGRPHIVILLDDAEISREEQIVVEGGMAGVTLIDLTDVLGQLTARRGMRIVVEPDRIGARGQNSVEWFGEPDSLTTAEATSVARMMSPYRVPSGTAAVEDDGAFEPLKTPLNYIEQLGLAGDPVTFDLNEAWRPRPREDLYRVAVGPGEQGEIVHLDIKETAYGGMGPHGLCIGATGSGKSEFLRTIVLGLLATHSSSALNFVLVDFKGGATFNGFETAPHVSASVSNLGDDATLVDRMQAALDGEMNRRQEVLNKAGARNVWDYRKLYEAGDDNAQEPMPALFVVIDEFSELLAQKPDFAELFTMIGRLGRSLQVHLLLASQRVDEGKLRGLQAHLSYRIGLKTFDASESRAAIGMPDAADLPADGGHGYLKHPEGMERFRAAYVSEHAHQTSGRRPMGIAASPVTGEKRPREFTPEYVEKPPEPETPVVEEPKEKADDTSTPTDFQLVIRKVEGAGPPAHTVWLPPLDAPPTLDGLLPPLQATDDRGYTAAGSFNSGRLQVPVGLIDVPYHQRQDSLTLDLAGAQGHGVVVGGPQAGKSNLLRTVITSMALTHTPQEVQFYCVDLGGGALSALRNLPHVGAFGGRRDPDTVRRTIAEIKALMTAREARFQETGLDSMSDFRARKQRGELTDDPYGDVFLVIDGWEAFRAEAEFEPLEAEINNLAQQGLAFGIHVFLSANRWSGIRPVLKDNLGTRLELRLGDPGESEVNRKVAVSVPEGRPGRGLHASQLHFLIALPRVDSEKLGDRIPAERKRAEEARKRGADEAERTPRPGWQLYNDDLADGVADLVNRVKSSWKGRPAPQVRLLPDLLPHEQLPTVEQQPRPHLVPIGINEDGLNPVYLDFKAEPHFYAFAERESGKTSLLRTIVRGITTRYTPQEALVLLVDVRRTMLGFIDSPHLMEYTVTTEQLKNNVRDVAAALKKRMPGPDVTQQQLRDRSWWSGPELFVVIDDYELVSPQGNNPLAPLQEYVAQATDVGLHVIIARNSGNAGRALFEPIIGKMREVSTPGLAMSADKDDGQLVGNIKSRQLPPGRGTLVSRRLRTPQLIQTAMIRTE